MSLELFQASYRESSDYQGSGVCALCTEHAPDLFRVGDDSQLAVQCGACAVLVSAAVRDGDVVCHACGAGVPLKSLGRDPLVCVSCLNSGRVSYRHETEYGPVGWREAYLERELDEEPLAPIKQLDPIQLPGGGVMLRHAASEEYFPKLPRDVATHSLRSLVGTPRYSSWQEPMWLFCCFAPMAYHGAWTRAQFHTAAEDGDGRALFERSIDSAGFDLWHTSAFEVGGMHVFKCTLCTRLRVNWEFD